MVKLTCPHEEQLASFVRCELSEEVAADVLDHLDSCPHCEETVAKLERTIRGILPGAAAMMIDMPYADESACQRAIQSLVSEFAAPIPDTDLRTEPKPIPEPNAPVEFQTLRDFRIIGKVGGGGMGDVYKAVHQRMQRTVALKLLPSAMIGNQSAVARFRREMSVLGQLNHPNIVQAFDAGDHDGQHYLAMELLEGQDLALVLRKQGRLSVANASLVVSQVATALQYAHEKGFVHRDIKPSNLMLAETVGADGKPQVTVKLLDLGLARDFKQRASADVGESKELTSADQTVGTLDYMAPEQASDSRQVDIRTDIYSLGATFYKLLTGEAPFAEHAHKASLKRLMVIATRDARPVMSRCPEIPEKLARIVHRMLEKDPARRFQTPAEVSKAIEDFTAGACLLELLRPGSPRKTEPKALAPSTEVTGYGSHGKRLSQRFVASLGGFVAFIALSALLVVTTRYGRVEVTSPDGQLPKDLKVVVLNGGEEIQVLQADNQWTSRLVNGVYEVALRGGDDQFEIEDSKLIITRLGKAVCVVTHTKATQPGGRRESPVDAAINSASIIASADAKREGAIATEPSAPIADRDKPFVVVDDNGKMIAEYRFANEVLAVPQNGIIEVHGNGPFKLGQVRREGGSLHMRAGQGYRPRFVVGFEMPEPNRATHWFDLTNVNFTVEGCDFHGASGFVFSQFAGTGGQWKFSHCRLIQPPTESGVVVSFSGDVFAVENSLLFNSSPTSGLLHLHEIRDMSLSENILIGQISLTQSVDRTLELNANVLFNTRILLVEPQKNLEILTIEATDNHFFPLTSRLITSATKKDPKQHVRWKGKGNHFVPFDKRPLWDWVGNEGEEFALNEITDWNAYWGNPDDLTAGSPIRFAWDFFDQPDWATSWAHIEAELSAARKKFPGLAQLGPDVSLVGSGSGWDETLRTSQTSEVASRPEVPEGGPFVILRDARKLAGYLSFPVALQETKDGDVIEVRSDGPFPEISVVQAVERRLTLRAAAGYRPVFDRFSANGAAGEWTLEGLHFRGLGVKPALSCASRRIANCSIDYASLGGTVHVRCPNSVDSVDIVNCYFSNHTEIISPSVKIVNSVLSTVETRLPDNRTDLTESAIVVERSCLWAHATPTRPDVGTAFRAGGKRTLRITDSLIDAGQVTYEPSTIWSGERNLYRTYGPNESKPATDEGSERDDSAFLRPELWQRK